MNKTAMQELYDKIKSLRPDGNSLSSYDLGSIKAINQALYLITEMLPTERQQIEDAYERGGYDEGEGIDMLPANYYDSTYKTS